MLTCAEYKINYLFLGLMLVVAVSIFASKARTDLWGSLGAGYFLSSAAVAMCVVAAILTLFGWRARSRSGYLAMP